MAKINIVDNCFKGLDTCSGFDASNLLTWNRVLEGTGDLTVFTDHFICTDIAYMNFRGIKVALLFEPRAIVAATYEFLLDGGIDNFDYVLTYDEELLREYPNKAHKYIGLSSRLWLKDMKIYNKNTNCMLMTSEKRQTIGHNLRHKIAAKFKDSLDSINGRGYSTFKYTLDVLEHTRYAVITENSKVANYFTDKILDCFLTGTIPVFWGCPNIGEYFNTDGFYTFDTLEELEDIFKVIGKNDYDSKKEIIKENFIKAKQYAITEDYLYLNFLKDII